MTINHGIQAVSSVYANTQIQPATRRNRVARPEAQDEFVVSKEAQSFSGMLAELQSMDEVRPEKVEAVSQQIANGTYQVSGADIAARMLNMRF